MNRGGLFTAVIALLHLGFASIACADKVILKDGTIFKGKILIDTDKGIVIGNPPFDPDQYYIATKDISTIVYEHGNQETPAERRRGFSIDPALFGNFPSSPQLSFHPAAGLRLHGGLRVHPLLEFSGGFQWIPYLDAKDGGLEVSDSRHLTNRHYQTFSMLGGEFETKCYPFYWNRRWAWEPYIKAGYGWYHLSPKGTGDTLKGNGWLVGAGILFPLSTHLFFDGGFQFQQLAFNTITFNGLDGLIRPEIKENLPSLFAGLSIRL